MNARLPDLVPMLRRLVETPSVSCTDPAIDQSNRGVVDELATWLADLGFAIELMPLPDAPHKANLVATLGTGPGGLVFAGHTDTVPCDPELWRSEPFRLEEREDRFYGLGTCDMKGFFPLAIEAARDLRAGDLARPLILLATADEECSMDGARILAQRGGMDARHVVIGEPTGLEPKRMHKGMMMSAIRIQGRSGHSSDPRLGASALDAMQLVLAELVRFREDLATRHRHPAFDVDFPTLNLGCLHAGDNPNRICGHAELQIDLRVLPGMDSHAIHAELAERLAPIAPRIGVELELVPLHPPVPPFETPASSDIVQAVERLTGVPAGAVAFGTEAPFFQAMGMDAVVLGPGHIDQAHQPDEYLELGLIEPTVRILRSLVKEFCVR
ncbi:MAG: acetylornithine deacetylase [Pseudomonadales bacterium]|jgi:acetylornithine deacetylase|nr:acetylornithine deacetylase [Pseudomonadales bacterium]